MKTHKLRSRLVDTIVFSLGIIIIGVTTYNSYQSAQSPSEEREEDTSQLSVTTSQTITTTNINILDRNRHPGRYLLMGLGGFGRF